MRILIFLTLIFTASENFAACTTEDLLKFQARAQCWHKNNERMCDKLPWLEGTAAATGLSMMAKDNPQLAQAKKYMDNVKRISSQLGRDYRAVLETYYDLKKKSSHPKFAEPMGELSYEEFSQFKNEIKAAHPKNLFAEKFIEYGGGSANDIFQRVTSYSIEPGMDLAFEKKTIGTHFPSTAVDLDRAKLIFREISVAKGYPGNAAPDLYVAAPPTREKMKDLLRQRQTSMNTTLGKFKGQAGRATVGGMMGVGTAAAALLPVIDLSVKRAAIVNCAQKFGLTLSEDETIHFARAIEIKKGIFGMEEPCDSVIFTAEGADSLLQNVSILPASRELMCRFEERYAKAQDQLDAPIAWAHANCQTTYAKKGQVFALMKKDSALVTTSNGTEVEVRWDGIGEWEYSSIKSLNDKDFGQYLIDKVKNPLNMRSISSKYMNPRELCDGRETGKYPLALCEVTKAMRTLSQNRNIAQAFCDTAKVEQPTIKNKDSSDKANSINCTQ